METTKIELIKIIASNGMWLTNGDTYSKAVYLGVNDSPDNWSEITEEEYNKIQEELKAEREQTKETEMV